ncbi:hypothetical protein C8R43DRAFT_1191758 [Mycena crocata]|nr:hypothetical protein C8R43DRAFT_1191758 [Mycena crocata]
MDVRQSLMTLGKHWDDDRLKTMFADDGYTACIFLRVIEVLEFDKETPILMVLFRQEFQGIQPSDSMARWIQLASDKKEITHITATPKEQHLLRLLQRNSERLPASYKLKRTSLEHDFVPSFLLPSVRKKIGRHIVQRARCTSLKGATSQTVRFIPFATLYNRYDMVQHRKEDYYDVPDCDPSLPLPNTHGSSPFIVKVQLNSADVNNFIDAMVPQTIEVNVLKFNTPPAVFDPIAKLVQTKGPTGLKIFCWATRSGDWTLDLCTDQMPEWQQW